VEGAEKNNEEITKATAYLIKTTIPEFVNEMSTFYHSLYENKPVCHHQLSLLSLNLYLVLDPI